MIANQVKGRGFGGCLNYVLGKEGAELIGGNMLGESAQELATEFSASRKMRPGLSRAVYHSSLSLAPGEKFTDSQWGKVAESYMKQMGFEGSQYCVVRHRDSAQEHVHIVASRIRMDGSYVSESQDYKRSEGILRGIEKEYSLKQVTPSRETPHRAPSRYELELAKAGVPSTKLQLQSVIDESIRDRPTMSTFLERMEASQVSVIPNLAKTGHISGVTFVMGREPMKGSDLGRGYTWSGLQKRGVNYEPDRDCQAISQAQIRAAARGHTPGTHSPRFDDRKNPPRGVSETARRLDYGADRAPVDRTRHDRQREPGQSHSNETAYGHLSQGFGRKLQRGPESSASDHATKSGPHPQAVGVDAPRKPASRSVERTLILRLAAAARRRETSSRQLARSSSPMAPTQPGQSEAGSEAPLRNPKSVKRFEKELEDFEAAQKLERDLEKKLQEERERQEREKNKGRDLGRGREIKFF